MLNRPKGGRAGALAWVKEASKRWGRQKPSKNKRENSYTKDIKELLRKRIGGPRAPKTLWNSVKKGRTERS